MALSPGKIEPIKLQKIKIIKNAFFILNPVKFYMKDLSISIEAYGFFRI
jgi:hypothetical protein